MLLLIGVILIAYFLSRFVTRSLETIKVRMGQMRLEKKNEKIYLKFKFYGEAIRSGCKWLQMWNDKHYKIGLVRYNSDTIFFIH